MIITNFTHFHLLDYLLGIVNTCVNDLNKLSEDDPEIKTFLDDFQRLTQVKQQDYWGGTLNGNACAKVQEKADFLIDFEKNDQRVAKIGRALKISGEIRKKLYTIGYLLPTDIVQIKLLFEKLKVEWRGSSELNNHSSHLKLHYLLEHSLDFIAANGYYTLGVYSEQEFESIHHQFDQILTHYSEKEDLRLKRLERAIALYNAVRFNPP